MNTFTRRFIRKGNNKNRIITTVIGQTDNSPLGLRDGVTVETSKITVYSLFMPQIVNRIKMSCPHYLYTGNDSNNNENSAYRN